MGFIVGLALFGAITYLPLYLQDVKGHSPTTSGLLILPLMVGLLTASIGSGQLITRFGRYKPFPVAGTAIMVVGLFLLSRLQVDTSTVVTGAYMLVLGFGLGNVIQVLVLAAQNAVTTSTSASPARARRSFARSEARSASPCSAPSSRTSSPATSKASSRPAHACRRLRRTPRWSSSSQQCYAIPSASPSPMR
jgi:MFS family permease